MFRVDLGLTTMGKLRKMTPSGNYHEHAYFMLLLKELKSLRSCEQRLHDESGEINERLNTMDVLMHNKRPQRG